MPPWNAGWPEQSFAFICWREKLRECSFWCFEPKIPARQLAPAVGCNGCGGPGLVRWRECASGLCSPQVSAGLRSTCQDERRAGLDCRWLQRREFGLLKWEKEHE